MSVMKTISMSDELYARWLAYQQRHPQLTLNQVCRESVQAMLEKETDICASTVTS